MFGIGFGEFLVIGVVLLLAVGPDKMPSLLKAVMKTYREVRRASRELRASTGIDEILQDPELQGLRDPLYVPPAKKPLRASSDPKLAASKSPRRLSLSYHERVQECPPEGVDLAELKLGDAPTAGSNQTEAEAASPASAPFNAAKAGAAKIGASGEEPV